MKLNKGQDFLYIYGQYRELTEYNLLVIWCPG